MSDMTEEKLEKIYRVLRIAIYAIPAAVILGGLYLVLFPVDSYKFLAGDPKLSNFDIEKDSGANRLSFGVFPARTYEHISLELNLKNSSQSQCNNSNTEIALSKTYKAFLYPNANPITSPEQLHDFLFRGNKTNYPNGALLHLKPTNQVFFISQGKKILFPGPEIFTAFGYSFDNLIDVDQSDIDQLPDADQKVFLWTMAHPNGTIFQAFPSHSLYLIFEGKKYPIESRDLLDSAWPQIRPIAVSDYDPSSTVKCVSKNRSGSIYCQFDSSQVSETGRYYFFSVTFPQNCPVQDIHPGKSSISFYSERSLLTVKNSLRTIAASILNRYFYKQ
jgi:hypothetical protein